MNGYELTLGLAIVIALGLLISDVIEHEYAPPATGTVMQVRLKDAVFELPQIKRATYDKAVRIVTIKEHDGDVTHVQDVTPGEWEDFWEDLGPEQ